MTAKAAPVIPLEEARAQRRPAHIEVAKAKLVETFMDLDTLATEAIYANGAAIEQVLRRLPTGPVKHDLQLALHETHHKLTRLVSEARMGSNRYDSTRPSR